MDVFLEDGGGVSLGQAFLTRDLLDRPLKRSAQF